MSLDAFRWDYLDRGLTPHLSDLARRGVRAGKLRPVFPSKTFPNHYSIVTGLSAGRHGLVANNIYDPALDRRFSLSDREAVGDGRWYGGEPIWVTAERHGLATAALFWPGTEAEIGGIRPTEWTPYDGAMPGEERVDRVLGWLARPAARRPSFVTLYFSGADDAGHDTGPAPSPRLDAAIREVDRLLGRLLEGIAGLRDPAVSVVVVSDHGLAATSPERVVFLDDYVDLDLARPVDWNPVAALWPEERHREAVYRALAGAHPALSVWRRDEIPSRFDYRHPRVPPILALADEGWSITSHGYFDRHPDRFAGGNHGYDNRLDSMAGIFVAAGPSIRRGVELDQVDNRAIYPLLCQLLDIPPVAGQGIPGLADRVLEPAAAGRRERRTS
ncbi:MAG: ectonucleotide pyrophosphatase/phosphodiesterase [Thermoanaerobaculia bacterium]|nr:ectonucleotide pyrophosphatase/phosphodiesterase [Thermoanaerobaculia bacterium]